MDQWTKSGPTSGPRYWVQSFARAWLGRSLAHGPSTKTNKLGEKLKKKIPIVFEFYPSLLDKNWIKNYDLVFKNYRFFYNLHGKNRKEKFNKENLIALFNKVNLIGKKYTDLMIV